MRSVQFDRDVRGQPAVLQGCRGKFGIRRSREEIAAHRDEHTDRAAMHLLDCLDCVGAVFARRIKIEFISQLFHERFVHALPDSHCAIALHVRVTTHGTRTRSRTSDVSTEEQEIHDLLNGRDRVPMLGQSHRPAANDAFRIDRDLCRRTNLFARHAAANKNVIPTRSLQVFDETIETCGEIFDEV